MWRFGNYEIFEKKLLTVMNMHNGYWHHG